MLYKIKFIKDTELKKIGDIVNCSKKSADSAVSSGYAEYFEEIKEDKSSSLKSRKKKQDIIIYDIETDGVNPETANLKFFGAYSYKHDKSYCISYKEKERIQILLKEHNILIGFNNKYFDNPIIERFLGEKEYFKNNYKILLDLFEISAPKGEGGFGKYNKNRLADAGIYLSNYKLDTIIKRLLPEEESKGTLDYDLLKKDSWNKKELELIETYTIQDILITKKLLDWYLEQFKPLEEFMSDEDKRKLVHIKSSSSVVGYNAICNMAKINPEYQDRTKTQTKKIHGGHHILPTHKKAKGQIIEIDFASAYPNAIIQANLFSKQNEGWGETDYYKIEGRYEQSKQGILEESLHTLLKKRLKAKKEGDKIKAQAYKIVINSIYGLTGNSTFKTLYNDTTALDCTSIVRTWIKKLAKMLSENGFVPLYGFTDSIFVLVPEGLTKDDLMMCVEEMIEEFKQNLPFPKETFTMGIDEEIKFITFFSLNCYMFLDKDNNLKYKNTLFNKNTPEIIFKILNDYVKPKIISELNLSVNEEEIKNELIKLLKDDITLAGIMYKPKDLKEYKGTSSINYKISERYGSGQIILFPNTAKVGVGKSKTYCSLEEFKENNLSIEDLDINKLLSHFKPFFVVSNEEVFTE